MPIAKRLLRFRWILPGLYLAALLFYFGLMLLNIGHTPAGFEFLLDLLIAPCHIFDLFGSGLKDNVIAALIICIGSGLVTYALFGAAIDLIVGKIKTETMSG